MNLKELDSFKLSDSIKFHDTLNPRLWMGTRLRPEVKKQLLVIADDFIQELGIKDLDVKDITVSGSNAAYSYSDHSDFDLHILVDMNKLPHDEVYRELFNAKKTIYNDSHNIKVHGVPIELYVQDTNEPVVSLGEYSLLQDKWLKRPTKRRANFDQNATKAKYDKLEILVTHALKTKNLKLLNNVIQKIKQYRKAGLDKGGEFSPENLAYKVLRNQGYITKLYDLRDKLHSAKLSIENMYAQEDYHPNAKPPGPEFKPTMPKGTVRVDVSDVYDWYKLGQHISNMKGLGKHDFGKGPPSTILSFGDEDTEHQYIKDLMKTGLTTTDIDPAGHKKIKGQKVDPTFNVNEESGKKSAIYSTDVYGMTAYHSKCLEPGCDWESKRYDSIKLAQNAAQKHAQKHFKQGVAEGSGKNVVKSVKVGNFRHDLVDTGMGWQVRIYNGDELYDTGMSKNSEQKGLAALEDAVAYTEKQTRTKRQGVAEGYSNTTFNVDRRKLNVPSLIQKGAIFVTYPHGEQGWETDNKADWAFSLLSLYNVLQGGWPSEAKKYLKPESYKRAEQQINSSAPNLGSDKLVYDGKYNQILWSIKKLGIPDDIAFLDKGQQGVAEAFDQPYKLKWEKGDHGDVDAYAQLPDGNYLSIMFNKEYNQDNEEAWSVEFYRNNSQEVTGEGDAQRVFATVLGAIQTFIKKYKPNRIIFSASKEVEPGQNAQSRANLYDRLVQRYAKSWGFKAFRADTGNKVIYELSRIKKEVEESASGYIPSNAEKDDPRFKTALTVDIKPDTMKKDAKKFGNKISRAGIPPTLNPSGKF